MSNFTTTEIQAAVEKIVRSTVRSPTGILGDRKIHTSFNDIQEAAAGVFILYFNAPFYVLKLGASRVKDLVQTQAQTVASLLDAVLATNRLVLPVSDLTPLANARTALGELEAAVASRAQGFTNIQQVPAFRRYAQSVSQFIETNAPSVTSPSNPSSTTPSTTTGAGLTLTDTPGGARAKIPGLARDLRDLRDELVRRVTLLSQGMEDFGSLNLPQVAAQGVISRARVVLDERFNELNALNEVERLDSLREVLLDLLTQKPIVQKYGAAQAPSEFITTSGLATAFSDTLHLATPAQVTGDTYGPYDILESSHFLKFTMDGGTPLEYPLPLAFIAELNSILVEPFNFTADRNQLRVVFDDPNNPTPTTFDITFPVSLMTAAAVVTQLNLYFSGSDLVAERFFYPLKLDTVVTISSLGGNDGRFTILGGSLSGLDIRVGDELDVTSGANAGTTWGVTAIDPSGQFLDATGVAPVVPVPLPGANIQVGPAARALRLRDSAPATSLSLRRSIKLPRTGGEEDLAAAILGFTPGVEARSRPVTAAEVASNIASSTSALTAEPAYVETLYAGAARSSPTDATQVALVRFAAAGVITGGTSVLFTSSIAVENVGVGDAIVIRSTLAPADLNAEGFVTAVTGNVISALFGAAVASGSVEIEIGPTVVFGYGDVLLITDGPNQGRYTTREPQNVGTTASFELLLDRPLPVPKNGSSPLAFSVSFGQETVRFMSRLERVESAVRVENGSAGTAAALFFTALPATARGTTAYLKFATYPKGASIGDLLLLYETQYNVVSRSFFIVGLEPTSGIVELDFEVESTASFSFDFDVPNPFGRIRVAQVADFAAFKAGLDEWLERPEQQEAYFQKLATVLNPLLVNKNPTIAQVNEAQFELKKLLSVLTIEGAGLYGVVQSPDAMPEDTLEFVLSNYTAPAVEPVDTLLSTLRQKSADRGIDLLTEGQFRTFFGLDMDGVSYSGTLTKSLRELARNDLPVRKFNREGVYGEKLIGTVPTGKDFEFDTSDADSPDTPEMLTDTDVLTPGGNY